MIPRRDEDDLDDARNVAAAWTWVGDRRPDPPRGLELPLRGPDLDGADAAYDLRRGDADACLSHDEARVRRVVRTALDAWIAGDRATVDASLATAHVITRRHRGRVGVRFARDLEIASAGYAPTWRLLSSVEEAIARGDAHARGRALARVHAVTDVLLGF